jgi:hypothetical protein
MEAGGWRYPSAADRRHALDASFMLRPLSAVQVGGALTAMSGAPYTRTFNESDAACVPGPTGALCPGTAWIQDPNGVRGPAYASLDLMADWSRSVRFGDVGVYLQVRNALGRDNASTYAGTYERGREPLNDGIRVAAGMPGDWYDHFERGLPRLPLVGFRLVF